MAGDHKRWKQVLVAGALALAAALAATVACSDDEPEKKGEGPNAELRRRTLDSLGTGVVLPLYREFATASGELKTAADAYAASPSATTRAAAQQAWTDAMAIWQKAELTQFGPAAMNSAVAGQELRARIYSWSLTNPCRVDQSTLSQEYQNPALLESQPTSIGLDALEYLLFVEGTGNACAPNLAINTSGEWAALAANPTELEQRRADYAGAVASIVAGDASKLLGAWDPDTGNFLESFAKAGLQGPYRTSQDALNALGEALLYLDTETKDMKLAEPAGLMNCATATCPNELESLWARQSKSHVRNNLLGFQRLYLGGDPGGPEFGIDDLLAELGATELSQTLAREIEEAIAAVDAIEEPTLLEALSADLASVHALHAAVKDITDLLKTQVTSILDLERPGGAPADND
jgi:uncharacterized protein